MTLAYDRNHDRAAPARVVPILRAGVLARDLCRRGGRGEVAAVFERSFYVRAGDEFICIGPPSIGNGPLTLIVGAPLSQFNLRQGQAASIDEQHIVGGRLQLGLRDCETWRPPPWPAPTVDRAEIGDLVRPVAIVSPRDSLCYTIFGDAETPLTRIARPRVAQFEAWLLANRPPARTMAREAQALDTVRGLIGLGPGLTPSGDDFLVGALATLDALGQTKIHAALAQAVAAAAPTLTSPLSACLLRAAAAGHVGQNLHLMVAAVLTGRVDAAVTALRRIGHTSGWDALAGIATTLRGLG